MQLKLEVTAALLIASPCMSLVKCTTYSLNGALVLCAHTHRFPCAPNHFYASICINIKFSPWGTPEWLDLDTLLLLNILNHIKPKQWFPGRYIKLSESHICLLTSVQRQGLAIRSWIARHGYIRSPNWWSKEGPVISRKLLFCMESALTMAIGFIVRLALMSVCLSRFVSLQWSQRHLPSSRMHLPHKSSRRP